MASRRPFCATIAATGSPRATVMFLALTWLLGSNTSIFGQFGGGQAGTFKNKEKPATPSSPVPNGSGIPGSGFSGNPGGFSGNFGGWGGSFGSFGGMTRFQVKIDPNTPVKYLLPVPPVLPPCRPPWLVQDLAQVPEVFFQKPLPVPVHAAKELEAKSAAEKEKLVQEGNVARQKATEQTAHTLAKINHLDQKGPEHFLKVLIEYRPDLAGLPFIMGDACRMSKAVSRQFVSEVAEVNRTLGQFGRAGQFGGFGGGFSGGVPMGGAQFGNSGGATVSAPAPQKPTADEVVQAMIGARMQMLAPEPSARRQELVKHLAAMEHQESTRALGRLAVFSLEKDVREAALAALKYRPRKDYTDSLLHGLRYPWPAFAKNAAEAMIELQRHDLVPALMDILDEPDPRAPRTTEVDGQCTTTLREVVRLNHHHNCITCHAPANSDAEFNKTGFSSAFVSGPVSIPGQDFSTPSFRGFGYFGGGISPDIFVRADVTYLRQDFSLMQKVENAHPWPAVQRFDFLVRTREVTCKEVDAYQAWMTKQGPKYVSPYQQAALTALRALTRRNAAPTAEAWRKALAEP